MENLDDDILLKITSYLNPVEMLRTALTCKRYGGVANDGRSLIEESARSVVLAKQIQLAITENRIAQDDGTSWIEYYDRFFCRVLRCKSLSQPSGYCQKHEKDPRDEDYYCRVCHRRHDYWLGRRYQSPCCKHAICGNCWADYVDTVPNHLTKCPVCRKRVRRNIYMKYEYESGRFR